MTEGALHLYGRGFRNLARPRGIETKACQTCNQTPAGSKS